MSFHGYSAYPYANNARKQNGTPATTPQQPTPAAQSCNHSYGQQEYSWQEQNFPLVHGSDTRSNGNGYCMGQNNNQNLNPSNNYSGYRPATSYRPAAPRPKSPRLKQNKPKARRVRKSEPSQKPRAPRKSTSVAANSAPSEAPRKPTSVAANSAPSDPPRKSTWAAANSTSSAPPHRPNSAVANLVTSHIDNSKDNEKDTASEMQKMLEQLRAKDPGMFERLLAKMTQTSETTSPSKPPAQQDLHAITTPQPVPSISIVSIPSSRTSPHPTSSSDLPDLGKFPAARRERISHPIPKNSPSKINNVTVDLITPPPFPDLGKFPAARRKRGRHSISSTALHDNQIDLTIPTPGPELQTLPAVGQKGTTTIEGSLDPSEGSPHINVDLPDLGKFPAARRKRRKIRSSEPGSNSLNQSVLEKGRDSSNVFTPPLKYSTLSVEEQRLSILEIFVRPGQSSIRNSPSHHVESQAPEPQRSESPKNTTLWPETKRMALAEAAHNYIANLPDGLPVTVGFLLHLIDQKSSYIQLCEQIESHGHRINRVHFAKHLLKAMPDLGSKSQGETVQQPPETQPESSSVGETTLKEKQTSASKPAATPSYRNGLTPAFQPLQTQPESSFVHATLLKAKRTSGSKPNTPSKAATSTTPALKKQHRDLHQSAMTDSTSRPERQPATSRHRKVLTPMAQAPSDSKEARARKRTFDEIVDLTQAFSDEENDNHGPKILQPPITFSEPSYEPSPSLSLPLSRNISTESPTRSSVLSSGNITTTAGPNSELQPSPAESTPLPEQSPKTLQNKLHQFRYNGDSDRARENLRSRKDIVKPIDAAKTLPKPYYDPRTIARDIMIAAGRHPTERPLNQHLTKLKEKFNAVNYTSDLETFRWELVDPGGPTAPTIDQIPLLIPQPAKQLPRDRPDTRDSGDTRSGSISPSHHSHPSHSNNQFFPENMPRTNPSAGPSPRIPGTRRNNRQSRRVEVVISSSPISKSPSNDLPRLVYECRWHGCGARLHNLVIFQKHIRKLHVPKSNDSTTCLWTGCNNNRPFSKEELQKHLEDEHLSPVARELGDGPPSISHGHPSLNSDAYLLDEDGRQLIPKATTDGSAPTIIFPATYQSIREFNKLHRHETDRSKAVEVLRSLKRKQANIGIGLARGGCTLMNAERQRSVTASETVWIVRPPKDETASQ
ncbi:hypothetical protein FQN57_000226 [Myotisia sp. PD_48]|nr:hypothetical protein FQN57_000226 [Myotisia sp. PD_48]